MVGAFESLGADHFPLNIRTKSELDLRIYFALRSLQRLIQDQRIDVVHAQTRITQVMGSCLKNRCRVPYLSTCHGFFKRRLVRRIFPCWGDSVIAVSEAVRDHLLRDFQVAASQAVLIKNGIDTEQFSAVAEATKKKNRVALKLNRGPVIGIIARLSAIKGHEILIAAMKKIISQFPQAQLLIVGEGRTKDRLQALTREFQLEDHVQFCPVVHHTPEVLSLLDVFVMPSFQEGLGLSVMEAQAMGLAVVASRVGGIPQLIEDGTTGLLVPPRNVDLLAEAILLLLRNPQKAQEMGERARAFIQKECSAQVMVEQTIRLYERLVGKKYG